MMTKNRATRLRRITMATTPTRSAASTHRAEAGNSRCGEAQHLGVAHVGGVGLPGGEGHEPPRGQARRRPRRPPPTTPGAATSVAGPAGPGPPGGRPRSTSASSSSHTTAPATANRAGIRWQSRVAANSTAASARCRPVRSPEADHAEEEQGERQAQREGELAGQGGEDVPPVDREARLEEEREGGRGQAARARGRGARPAGRRPRRTPAGSACRAR